MKTGHSQVRLGLREATGPRPRGFHGTHRRRRRQHFFFSGWLPLSRLKEIDLTIKTLRPGSSDLDLDLEEKAHIPADALLVI